MRSLRARIQRGPVIPGRTAREVPQLRQEATPPDRSVGDRVQGVGLVQDGQPPREQERGRDERHERDEDGDQERDEAVDEAGEGRKETGGRGAEPSDTRGRILATSAAVGRRSWRVAQAFGNDDCAFLAGAIAYQVFFALVPLLALLVGILGFVYGSDRAQRELVEIIREIYPSASAQETRIARELVDGRAFSLGLGLVGTLFSVIAIQSELDSALAAVLGRESGRPFVRSRLEAGLFIAALAGLAVVSFAVSYGAQLLSGALAAAGFRAQVRLALQVGSPNLGALVGYAFFSLVYPTVPRPRPPPRGALQAALGSPLLWGGAQLRLPFFTPALQGLSVDR